MRDVLSGTDQLDDDTRERATYSGLLEVSYGLTDRFSFSTLLTLVQQERKISAPGAIGPVGLLRSRGIGDAAILLKYSIARLNLVTQREIAIGAGTKVPLGRSSIASNGILIPEDMQPGTGAWDGILWSYLYQGFLPSTRFNLFVTTSYRFTGTNARDYRFGNEFTSTIGTSYRTDLFFDLSLQLRYRSTQHDQRFGSEITNTGERWFYAIPGLNLKLTKDFSIRLSTELPVYRNLKGTQLTKTYKLAVSLFYNLVNSKF